MTLRKKGAPWAEAEHTVAVLYYRHEGSKGQGGAHVSLLKYFVSTGARFLEGYMTEQIAKTLRTGPNTAIGDFGSAFATRRKRIDAVIEVTLPSWAASGLVERESQPQNLGWGGATNAYGEHG